jgi:hypothetical protein
MEGRVLEQLVQYEFLRLPRQSPPNRLSHPFGELHLRASA